MKQISKRSLDYNRDTIDILNYAFTYICSSAHIQMDVFNLHPQYNIRDEIRKIHGTFLK